MKHLCILISSILLFLACSSDNTDIPSRFDAHKITFIGQNNDAQTEIVIKKMIRSSILDNEYIILSAINQRNQSLQKLNTKLKYVLSNE